MAVSLHRGSAARCVDDDGVGVGRVERVDEFPAAAMASSSSPACSASAPQHPCVCGTTTSQPSAASTRAVASLTLPKNTRWTHPSSSATRLRCCPCAGMRAGRAALPKVIAGSRRSIACRRFGSSREKPGRVNEALDAELLIDTERPRQRAQPSRMGKHRENHSAERAIAETALRLALDLRPRRLEQRVVLHARRAGGDARHAPEARVDVLDEALARGFAAVAPQFHQMDAAARRVGLLSPQQIGRAGRQTEPAVDAVVEEIAPC